MQFILQSNIDNLHLYLSKYCFQLSPLDCYIDSDYLDTIGEKVAIDIYDNIDNTVKTSNLCELLKDNASPYNYSHIPTSDGNSCQILERNFYNTHEGSITSLTSRYHFPMLSKHYNDLLKHIDVSIIKVPTTSKFPIIIGKDTPIDTKFKFRGNPSAYELLPKNFTNTHIKLRSSQPYMFSVWLSSQRVDEITRQPVIGSLFLELDLLNLLSLISILIPLPDNGILIPISVECFTDNDYYDIKTLYLEVKFKSSFTLFLTKYKFLTSFTNLVPAWYKA